MFRGILRLVLPIVVVFLSGGFAPGSVISPTGFDQFPAPGGTDRNRGDVANIFDGNINTASYATSSYTYYPDHGKQRLAVGFDPTSVNRLRVSKYGDVIFDDYLPAYPVDLTIYATGDSTATPLENRTWSKVGRLSNGYNNGSTTVEQIDATAVHFNGMVLEDVDNKGGPQHPGYPEFYSLTFQTVKDATGLMIEFNNSQSSTQTANHYRVREFEAHFDSDAVLVDAPVYGSIVNVDMQYSAGSSEYSGPSPIESDPTWNHVAVDNPTNLLDSDGVATAVGLTLSGAGGRWDSDWSEHDLLEDYLHRYAGATANALVTGLDDRLRYDLYIYTGVEGGQYTVGSETLYAAYDANDPAYNPGPSTFADFVDGKNYVVFRDLSPTAGQILLQYTDSPFTTATPYANLSGLTIAAVVPEPGALSLLGIAGLTLLSLGSGRRRR